MVCCLGHSDVHLRTSFCLPEFALKNLSWRAGGTGKKLESKESVVSGARALTLLCHWGNCKTKEDDIRHTRMQPHIKVRLKVCPFSVPSPPYAAPR